MKTETLYTCEICGYNSTNQKDVAFCEAKGFPKIPDYLSPDFDFNKEVSLYGRRGKKTAKILSAVIQNVHGYPGTHEWILLLDRYTPLGDSDWSFNGYERECFVHYLDPKNTAYFPHEKAD